MNLRKGPRRSSRPTDDLEHLLSLPLFSSSSVKQVVRAYGPLGVEAAAVLIAAAYQRRFAEYVVYLDEGIREIGSYASAKSEDLASYLQSLSIDVGVVKKTENDKKTDS